MKSMQTSSVGAFHSMTSFSKISACDTNNKLKLVIEGILSMPLAL